MIHATSDTVTEADVEHLARTVGLLAGEPYDSTLTSAAPENQQSGGGGAPDAA